MHQRSVGNTYQQLFCTLHNILNYIHSIVYRVFKLVMRGCNKWYLEHAWTQIVQLSLYCNSLLSIQNYSYVMAWNAPKFNLLALFSQKNFLKEGGNAPHTLDGESPHQVARLNTPTFHHLCFSTFHHVLPLPTTTSLAQPPLPHKRKGLVTLALQICSAGM